MPQIKYKCNKCLKDFMVKYIFLKPGKISCPYCGTTNVRENNARGCSGGGSRFT